MTQRGVGFLLLTALVYLAANQTRVGWLYLATAGMLAAFVLSWLLSWWWAVGLRAERRIYCPPGVHELQEGHQATVQVNVCTRHLLPSYLLQVRDHLPFAPPSLRDRRMLIAAAGRVPTERQFEVECWRRGRYDLPALAVHSPGLFGVTRITRWFDAGAEVTVRPWYLPPEPRSAAPAALLTERETATAGSGIDVLGTRDYAPGDPLRSVHWRASARRQQLVTKQFAREASVSLTLVLDITVDDGIGRDSTLEACVKLAASLAAHGLAQGKAVRLLAGDLRRPITAWRELLEYLTLVEVTPGAATAAQLLAKAQEAGGSVVLLAAAPPDLGTVRVAPGVRLYATAFEGYEGPGGTAWPTGVTPLVWRRGEPATGAVQRALGALEAPDGASNGAMPAERR